MTFDNDNRRNIQKMIDQSKSMFANDDDISEKLEKLNTIIASENEKEVNEFQKFAEDSGQPAKYVPVSPLTKACAQVWLYVSNKLDKTDTHVAFGADDVYIVCFCYILGGWKALVSTTLPDGMYYEVTYNKEKCETYLDAYKKFENVCIPD